MPSSKQKSKRQGYVFAPLCAFCPNSFLIQPGFHCSGAVAAEPSAADHSSSDHSMDPKYLQLGRLQGVTSLVLRPGRHPGQPWKVEGQGADYTAALEISFPHILSFQSPVSAHFVSMFCSLGLENKGHILKGYCILKLYLPLSIIDLWTKLL